MVGAAKQATVRFADHRADGACAESAWRVPRWFHVPATRRAWKAPVATASRRGTTIGIGGGVRDLRAGGRVSGLPRASGEGASSR